MKAPHAVNAHARILKGALVLMLFAGAAIPLSGEITVRLLVKYILQPKVSRPEPGNIGTRATRSSPVTVGQCA